MCGVGYEVLLLSFADFNVVVVVDDAVSVYACVRWMTQDKTQLSSNIYANVII
jgi:hypothetical protein